MNKLTLEKIATPLLKACKDEGVMYKEAARIFNTEPAYFKMLEREDKRGCIPEKVMDRFHSWVYSGKKLKEYKMPGSFEEAQREADAGIENPVMEELADILNEHGAVILEPTKEPVIKVKPEALAKRKKEMAERKLNKALEKSHEKAMVKVGKKPKRKYTRKPKENPLDAAPEEPVKVELSTIEARELIGDIVDLQRYINRNEAIIEENKSLKSEIKTLAFLLAREHEANEVLRAHNGYLNAFQKYWNIQSEDVIKMIREFKEGLCKDSDKTIDRLRKENNELEDQIRKYLRQGFWDRVLRRPVK